MAVFPEYFVGQRLTATLLQSATPITASKVAGTSRASTVTLSADPDLQLTVEANALYEVALNVRVTGPDAGDFKFGWSGPAGAAFMWSVYSISITGTAYANAVVFNGDLSSSIGVGVIVAPNPTPVAVMGQLDTAGTAGTFAFTWSQNTSNATSTIVAANSFLRLTRIG